MSVPRSSAAQVVTAYLLFVALLVGIYCAFILTVLHAEIVSCSKNPKVADANTCIVHTGPVSKTYP